MTLDDTELNQIRVTAKYLTRRNMNIDKKLDEILDTLMMEQEGTHCNNSKPYIEEIKQLFQDLIDEVIGEDYYSIKMPFHKEKSYTIYLTTNPKLERKSTQIKNKLRAKQRQRAKELLEDK